MHVLSLPKSGRGFLLMLFLIFATILQDRDYCLQVRKPRLKEDPHWLREKLEDHELGKQLKWKVSHPAGVELKQWEDHQQRFQVDNEEHS